MSGASGDGVEAVLVDFSGDVPFLVAQLRRPYSPEERATIAALAGTPPDALDRLADLDVELGRLFATSIQHLLAAAGVPARQVKAIGSHGHTVRHRPGPNGCCLQLGDPSTIAERTGITTVADFRRRDIAAGGKGAPLVPAFHAALCRDANVTRVVATLSGGLANVSILPADASEPVSGFDTGPANVLMDAWIARHRGERLDRDGAWARQGIMLGPLLSRLLDDPFFEEPPPKRADRARFDLEWLTKRLDGDERPQDVQATLCELTAVTLANAIRRHAPAAGEVVLSGGGAYNGYLRGRIAAHLTGIPVSTTERYGIAPEWVEAAAFAWLARQTLAAAPGNLPEVTGARRAVILGAIYRA
ncbi:MAG: anhydro-N-acetylmuramic acid kinase [Thiohalomonadaceae bacterium]